MEKLSSFAVYSDDVMAKENKKRNRFRFLNRFKEHNTQTTLSIISTNEVIFNGYPYYRKGHEPIKKALFGSASTLDVGKTYERELVDIDAQLFFVSVEDGVHYKISWDDLYNDNSSYTADIQVSAYGSGKTTAYFEKACNGYSSPKRIIAAGDILCIVVHPYDFDTNYIGTYSLAVTKQ